MAAFLFPLVILVAAIVLMVWLFLRTLRSDAGKRSYPVCPKCGAMEADPASDTGKLLFSLFGSAAVKGMLRCRRCGYRGLFPTLDAKDLTGENIPEDAPKAGR